MNRLSTEWVNVKGIDHLFAGSRPGMVSLCGARRHPAERGPLADTRCFVCVQHLRTIQNPEKASWSYL